MNRDFLRGKMNKKMKLLTLNEKGVSGLTFVTLHVRLGHDIRRGVSICITKCSNKGRSCDSPRVASGGAQSAEQRSGPPCLPAQLACWLPPKYRCTAPSTSSDVKAHSA